MPYLVQTPQLQLPTPPPRSAAAMGVPARHHGSSGGHQLQQHRRRQSSHATLIWKLGVPIILLLSVFTLVDRLGRDIQDMNNVQTVATTTTTTTTTTSTTAMSKNQGILFDYSQPTVPSNTTLKDPTADYSTANTIVFVLSARGNFQRRAVIRQTWGLNHAVYFVIGGPPPLISSSRQIQHRLVLEQATHHDLLDSIHPDSYRSLPHKLRFAYQWILQRWPQVQWLVKVDDDSVARIDTLQRVVLDPLNPAIPIVVGCIMVDELVLRQGKWAEENYPEARYPYWPQGSCGHVVSRPVAAYVTQKAAQTNLTLYQGEDTSLGIWLHDAAMTNELHVTWIRSHYFTNSGKCQDRNLLVIGHRITVSQMEACYKLADEWPDDHDQDLRKHLWYVTTEEQKIKHQWWRWLVYWWRWLIGTE
jgi:hypothetical protein